MAINDKINIDFQILGSNDPRFLNISDYSIWGQIESKPSIIEIIAPGEEFPWVHFFKKGQQNVITSVDLGLSCPSDCGEIEFLDLPDGIYTITVKGSPDSFNKSRKYLRTELIQLELDKMYINLDLLCKNKDVDILNTLTDIDLLLKAASANVRHDNICTAQELFFKAQDLIEQAKGCNGCVGA